MGIDVNNSAYYERVWNEEIDALSCLGANSGRDSQLWRSTRNLYRHVLAGVWTEAEVLAGLRAACATNGLAAENGERAIESTIQSGIRAAKQAGPAKKANDTRHEKKVQYQSVPKCTKSEEHLPPAMRTHARPIREITPTWVRKAQAFWDSLTFNALTKEERAEATQVLGERGLDPETAYTKLGIKWVPRDTFPGLRTEWGLEPKEGKKGGGKQYVAKGLLFACKDRETGLLVGLVSRCANYCPDGPTWEGYSQERGGFPKEQKLLQVEGGASPLSYAVGNEGQPCIFTESAVDAGLLYTLTGGEWACLGALGTKTVAGAWSLYLQKAPRIVYIKDADSAGDKEGDSIQKQYPRAEVISLPQPYKDPTAITKALGLTEGREALKKWLAEASIYGQAEKPAETILEPSSPAMVQLGTLAQGVSVSIDGGPVWLGDYDYDNPSHEPRPCCYLRSWYLKDHPRLASLLSDRKAYGIPSAGVPLILRGFSLNGWQVKEDGKLLILVPVGAEQSNYAGCKAYLRLHEGRIREALKQWAAYQEALA